MDLELKQYLDAMEARSAQRTADLKQGLEGQMKASEANTVTLITDLKKNLEGQIKASEANTVTLITDLKESLERQINTGFEDVASRFDAQSMRLDRQAALQQTGSRWTNRMNDWAENVDVALEKKTQEIAELRQRVDKLEGGAK